MDINAFFDTLSLDCLVNCQKLLDDKIKTAKIAHRAEAQSKKAEDYVEMLEDFVPDKDGVLFQSLLAEIESLGMKTASGSTSSKWTSSDDETYSWSSSSGKETVNQPIEIDSFPGIKKLMDKVNLESGTDMNSCLVTHFPDGKSYIRLHADGEQEMAPDSPICVFTVGQERPVEFLSMYQAASEQPLLTVIPKAGSLYIMKPGCQSFFRHRVPTTASPSGKRYLKSIVSYPYLQMLLLQRWTRV